MKRVADANSAKVIAVTAAMVQRIAEMTGNNQVGAQQILLLLALYEYGDMNQADLPKYTGVEKSANSRNLQALGIGANEKDRTTGERKPRKGLGLCEAYDDPLDGRFKRARLTPQGRALIEEAARAVSKYLG